MQFVLMPEKGSFDAVFILRRMQKEYHSDGKSCKYLVDLEKTINRVLRKAFMWAEKRNSRNFG